MPIFRKSIMSSECDECRRPFSISSGGVCENCRRILCTAHLHGSVARRLAIAFGARMLCVRCRTGQPIPPMK